MQQEINLYALMTKASRWSPWLAPLRVQTAFLVFLILLMAVSFNQGWQVHKQARVLLQLTSEQTTKQARLNALSGRVADDSVQAALLKFSTEGGGGNSGMSPGRSFPEILRALAVSVLPGLWLTSFQITNTDGKLALTGATLNPMFMQSFLDRLGRQSAFTGVSFQLGGLQKSQADEKTTGSWMVFQISGNRAANG